MPLTMKIFCEFFQRSSLYLLSSTPNICFGDFFPCLYISIYYREKSALFLNDLNFILFFCEAKST